MEVAAGNSADARYATVNRAMKIWCVDDGDLYRLANLPRQLVHRRQQYFCADHETPSIQSVTLTARLGANAIDRTAGGAENDLQERHRSDRNVLFADAD